MADGARRDNPAGRVRSNVSARPHPVRNKRRIAPTTDISCHHRQQRPQQLERVQTGSPPGSAASLVALPTNHDSTSNWPKRVSLAHMPHWLPPFAAAASAVLVLNIALMVQRVREQSKTWPARFLRDLRRWDGRLPDDLDQHVHT